MAATRSSERFFASASTSASEACLLATRPSRTSAVHTAAAPSMATAAKSMVGRQPPKRGERNVGATTTVTAVPSV